MLLSAGSAFGQAALAPSDPVTKADTANADGSTSDGKGDIVVTGSRIRSPYKGADNVVVIKRAEAVENGFSTTTDLLQSNVITNGTSQINNAYGGYVTNGGPGANTISLRGLGTSRTLLLLNGRRLAPSGSRGAVGSVDLNSLPSSMVDRIEVLNAGASSVYGSDAVAGVINVITRKAINGLEFDGEVTVPGVGAGVSKRIAAVFGTSGDNFEIDGSLEYYKRSALTFGDRSFTQCQTQYRNDGLGGGPDSGDIIDPLTGKPKCYGIYTTGDSGLTINTLGTPSYPGQTVALAPGIPANYTGTCNRFRPNPNVTTGALPGFECVGGSGIGLQVRDTFPNSLLNQALISGTENYNGFLSGSYKIHALGDAELYGEVLGSRRKSSQLEQRQFTIDYNQGSLLLPASLRNGNFSGACTATTQATYSTCMIGTPIAARVFANYGNYNNYQTVDFVKFSGGLRGGLPFDFHYDAYASKAFSDAKYTTDLILTNRLAQSLNVVASGTGFACANPSGGCVAAPALTGDVISGNLPAAFVNYVVAPVTGTTKFRETTFNLTVDGPLFALPGGTAQLVVGAEHRTQNLDDTPDTNSQIGNLYGFSSSTITRGSDAVSEVYGELELPVLHDQVVHDLTLNASGRYTNYRSYGGGTTYKFGGVVSPVEWFSVRGSYGTSFRAPALFEQYLGATSGFISGTNDPCSNLLPGSSPILLRNCIADGVPAPLAATPGSPNGTTGYVANNSVQVNQRGGAASGLKAETSTNINIGGVFSPHIRGGSFSLSVDYFDINVSNGISSLSGATVLSQCYNDANFRASGVCALVSRPALGTLIVTSGYVNISTSVLRGIDYSARFSHDVGPGRLLLNAKVTQYLSRYDRTLPTDTIVEEIGLLTNPRFTGVFDATYAYKRFGIHYSGEWTQHTDSTAYLAQFGYDNTYNFHTPDYWVHAVSVNYVADKFSLTLGVRNLLNTNPPSISDGAYSRVANAPLYSGYDFVGRQFFMNVTTKF
jgi:outer membrane receptor protein involved in Fe transport